MKAQAVAAWLGLPSADATAGSDFDLVARTKAGEIEAFSVLVRRHQHVVYNLAYRFMREGSLAEDMAQEAFLKAFRLLKGFRGDCSFSTWMYRVTCSVCLTELNRRKKWRELELRSTFARETASAAVENADLPELIRGCVAKLPGRYATVIALYYLEGVPYEEIAAVMRIPIGTLKTWMHRARGQLRHIIEKELCRDGSAAVS